MKSKTTAVLLAFFGGIVGAHRFYLGQTGKGIMSLGVGLILGPCFALYWLLSSNEAFDNKYNNQRIQRAQMDVQKEMLEALKNK